MSWLRQRVEAGGRDALAAFGVAMQPSLASVGIKAPKAPAVLGLPSAPKAPAVPKAPSAGGGMPKAPGGVSAAPSAKAAADVGMGASTSTSGGGAVAGEPADAGRRQRSVIDRALQRNEDDFATSSMPLPGDVAP